MEDQRTERQLLILSKQIVNLERSHLVLKAAVTVLKSYMAHELHAGNPGAFLELLRETEAKILDSDPLTQAKRGESEVFDALLRGDWPKPDEPKS